LFLFQGKPAHRSFRKQICLALAFHLLNELFFLLRSTVVDVGQDEATACSLLKEMALKIHELVGARMHHLSVCQWEVKLKLESDGPAGGSWRVVTTNVTSHTCAVDVSLIHLHLVLLHGTN
jgi:hypothetical protein